MCPPCSSVGPDGASELVSFHPRRAGDEPARAPAGYPSGQRGLTVNQLRELRGFESLTCHPGAPRSGPPAGRGVPAFGQVGTFAPGVAIAQLRSLGVFTALETGDAAPLRRAGIAPPTTAPPAGPVTRAAPFSNSGRT